MASSSKIVPNKKYDVFISHRVQDTGNNFTSHLTSALRKDGMDAIFNDGSDEEVISETLLTNISNSPISVVVISKSYGGSPRCLEELVKVIECMEKNGQRVLPVFLGVQPTHVRNQVGDFGIFFKKIVQSQEFMQKESSWKHALTETSNLSGWVPNGRSEDTVVDDIVKYIGGIIDKQPLLVDSKDGFVGIAQVTKIESLLNLQSTKKVLLVGIWGMGGIGKTAIAQRIFEKMSYQFDGACLLNFKQRFEWDSLWRAMYSELLKSQDLKNLTSSNAKRLLERRKVLVILDDVTRYSCRLPFVETPENYFALGSRIILTSRDKQLLKSIYNCKKEHIYQVQELSHNEAVELFGFHAFKQQPPTEWQKELSIKVVRYAGGLPLALIVMGCHLYDKNIEEWKSDLEKLKNIPGNYKEIKKILKISFKRLEWHEQSIFLDIACAFYRRQRSQIVEILDACGFHAVSGIRSLLDKALRRITWYERVVMHDLLQQLGQNIVLSECKDQPGKRSRLWKYIDFHKVMTENKGTNKVEVISVDLAEATACTELKPGAFRNMLGLRVLNLYRNYGIKLHLGDGLPYIPSREEMVEELHKFYLGNDIKLHLRNGLDSLPNKLVELRWDYYPLASLPDNFCPHQLVELNLRHSNIKQLWSAGVDQPPLPNLKSMDLSDSMHLIYLPDFSMFPNLERIELQHCLSLEEIPKSILHLSKLHYFNALACTKLARVSELPRNLVHLILSMTAIEELPSSIGCLSQLEKLDLSYCFKLHSLPTSIGELDCLQFLHLRGCSILKILPDSLANLKSLIQLSFRSGISGLISLERILRETVLPKSIVLEFLEEMHFLDSHLESLPASIKHLPNLKELNVAGCRNLICLPDLPPSLVVLRAQRCTSLRSVGNLFGGDQMRPIGFAFNLMNCISLGASMSNRALEDARPKLEVVAQKSLFLESNGYQGHFPSSIAELRISGSELPEWVKYKENGSKLHVKLSDGRLEDFSRLLFCLVATRGRTGFPIRCNCLLVSKDGEHHFRANCGIIRDAYSEHEHVFIWYETLGDWTRRQGPATPLMCSEATFEFEIKFRLKDKLQTGSDYDNYAVEDAYSHVNYESRDKVLRCGVSPLGGSIEIGGSSLVEAGNQEQEEGLCGKRLRSGHNSL